ncbi:uncharacterized protein TNCV_3625171 [Trichonephila clavipes]|nr:uncharacterized protein TNCV_3625171 [Trichonephila clavipes]
MSPHHPSRVPNTTSEKRKWLKPQNRDSAQTLLQGNKLCRRRKDNPCDFTPPQPVCFSFRFSCSLPAARLLQLNQTSSVFTGLRTRLKGFSITK